MDWFERAREWCATLWRKIKEGWAVLTLREKAWVGVTILATIAGIFAGGLVPGAIISGLVTALGAAWLLSYNSKVVAWVAKYRAKMDVVLGLPLLFAPLFLGANMGLLVVFCHLYITTILIFISTSHKVEEERIIEVEAHAIAA